ncbi:hypothetical protein OA848_03645 [Rickettsiales bacterium]|nr:hypothetical protein [Rickettsiales bacterium]
MQYQLNDFLDFANNFADKSGKILKKKFEESFNIETKKDGSMVTEVDQQIEELFIKELKKEFPEHGVIGEEYGYQNPNSSHQWIIDPLDGTHSFIAGKPLFGTLLCLTIENIPILGLIDIPILNQRWKGLKGLGVKKNLDICKIDDDKKHLKDCILSSTSLLMFDSEHLEILKKIYEQVKFPIFGTDCYAYGLLLSGKIDLIIEANMKPWDYMAQVALIKEAGGIISDWSGSSLTTKSDGKVIAAKSEKSYSQAMIYLNKIK